MDDSHPRHLSSNDFRAAHAAERAHVRADLLASGARIAARVEVAENYWDADNVVTQAERAYASLNDCYRLFIGGKPVRRPDDFARWLGRSVDAYIGDMNDPHVVELFEAMVYRCAWRDHDIDVQAWWDALNLSKLDRAN